MKKSKTNISKLLLSKISMQIISWAAGIAMIFYVGFFLYTNFYQTLAQTEQIIVLKQEVAPDTIDKNRVDNVLNILENKIRKDDVVNWDSISNPFIPYQSRDAEVE